MTSLGTWRNTIAYFGLLIFVVAATIGGFLVSAAVGWFALAFSVLVATFLLGAE